MGSLDPSEKEMSLLSKFHIESAKLRGTEVTINYVEDTDLDVNHDPEYEFVEGEQLHLILEERPSERLLRSLDWFNEDEEDLPLIAYIAREDWDENKLHLLEGTRIELPYQISSEVGSKLYEMIKIKALPPNGLAYVCQLVPLREEYEEEKEEDSEENINYSYLNAEE